MSIWTRIAEALSALAKGEGLTAVFDRLRTPPERSVGFAIAVIALGAKLAKADGQVTRNEVRAFREVFTIPPGEEGNAARVFDLARQDVAGYEEYARRIARLFGEDSAPLHDLLEGLFYIAIADGDFHPEENAFLARVAEIFGIGTGCFGRIRAQYVPDAEADPFEALGLPPGASLQEARQAWRALVRECHPDRIIARGLPEESVRLAERRLIGINRAMERIAAQAGAPSARVGRGGTPSPEAGGAGDADRNL